jgi:F0F1-type ATP synthase membrane subunit a
MTKPSPSFGVRLFANVMAGVVVVLGAAYLVLYVMIGFGPEIRVISQFFK